MGSDRLTIGLLGGFTVAVGDLAVPDERWRLRRAADLVKVLALAPRHRLSRDQLVETFWPESDPVGGAANVRKVIFRARQVFQLPDIISLEDGIVHLAPGREIETDVAAFVDAARDATASGDPEAFRHAASLYGGDLLPDDLYAPWCSADREHLRSTFHTMLAGGELWGRLVREVPTDERAHREIMRAQLAQGDRASVIRQFGALRTTLHDELGVSPQPETVAVYELALDTAEPNVPTPAERAQALLAWGLVHWQRAELDEAARTASTVRALAIDAGLPRELTEASELLGLVAYAQGRWREVFADVFLASASGSPDMSPFILDANMCMSEFALHEPTGIDDIATLAGQMIGAADELGSPHARGLGHLLRGEAALLAGESGAGVRDDLDLAARIHGDVSSGTGRALALARLAQLDAIEANMSAARPRHREALQIAEQTSVPEHLLLCVYGGMFEGEPLDRALSLIAEAERAMVELTLCDPCSMSFRTAASRTCSQAGDLVRAEGYLATAERIAGMWSGGPWHASVLEARADLERARGARGAVVADLLDRAARIFAASKRRRDAARCFAGIAALG